MNDMYLGLIGLLWIFLGVLSAMVIGRSEKLYVEQDKKFEEEQAIREKFDQESA